MSPRKEKPCCPLLELAASRAKDTDRIGLMRGLIFRPVAKPKRTMEISLPYVLRFRKAPRGSKDPNAAVAFAVCSSSVRSAASG